MAARLLIVALVCALLGLLIAPILWWAAIAIAIAAIVVALLEI